MFNLLAKFGLDGSGFHRGMDNVEAKAKKTKRQLGTVLGRELGQELKTNLMSLFGFSAILAGMKSAVGDATRIREESAKAGKSMADFQRAELASRGINGSMADLLVLTDEAVIGLSDLGYEMERVFQASKRPIGEFAAVMTKTIRQIIEGFHAAKLLIGLPATFTVAMFHSRGNVKQSLQIMQEFFEGEIDAHVDRVKLWEELDNNRLSVPRELSASSARGSSAAAGRASFESLGGLGRAGLFQSPNQDPAAKDRREQIRQLEQLNKRVSNIERVVKDVV